MESRRKVSLKSLTEEDIQKAFEKTRGQFDIPGVKLVLVTEEYYEKTLELCRDYFVPDEPINKAVGLEYNDEMRSFWLQFLKLHLSLLFIDEESGEPIGFRTTNISCRDEKLDLCSIKSNPLREVLSFIAHCENESRFFDHYETDEAFNFLGLVVAEKYKRRGFATKLFRAALEMIRNLGFDEVYVKGGGTSNFSKKIYEREGFETLYEKFYDSYEVNGNFPIQNTGEHKSMKVYGLKVTPDKC
ncbi:uncharacterized protein LOC132755670 [Ruditapes philippinarum]|uniref:uncharacterized protein LOC132755670 n=1 Tax=Ruditapes philippinarum TaxID=129788 RepID=UPI00295B72B2|nr:uncharacterized protein LOC132755670 [Ruditapes philippinarum]